MDYIDRSTLGKYRDPARLARSRYVHCLLKRAWYWLQTKPSAATRPAPCG